MRNRFFLFLFFFLSLLCSAMVHAECTCEQMAEAFHVQIEPSIEVLEDKVEGMDVFPEDVCYDMRLVFLIADDTLAGGDGSISAETPWRKVYAG